ncbi:hypothetical protein HNY73_013723 [Argiope bruennichi]|uniref:Uncharacterized protein n=1 Tax=Argiope bruennichi TaxID=94029 RepID=A0A8T0EM06_ARGBR|nr:hypothetical protein HNY73_013723 [Argiope bruennichi]
MLIQASVLSTYCVIGDLDLTTSIHSPQPRHPLYTSRSQAVLLSPPAYLNPATSLFTPIFSLLPNDGSALVQTEESTLKEGEEYSLVLICRDDSTPFLSASASSTSGLRFHEKLITNYDFE